MALVSIIIPTYNRTFSLRSAIESILLQTYLSYEIIIVDDGSSFNVENCLKNYLENYLSPIKIIKLEKNSGVSKARNKGIKSSRGEYIAFLDSDDLYLPNKLKYQIKYMEDNNFLISHSDEYWYRDKKYINQGKNNRRYGGYIFHKILDKCRISPSSLIIHKSVFDSVGYFNESLRVCEDYELALRMAYKYEIGYLEKKLIIKRAIEKNSLSKGIKHIEYIRYNILKEFYGKYKEELSDIEKEQVEKEIARKGEIVSSGKINNPSMSS